MAVCRRLLQAATLLTLVVFFLVLRFLWEDEDSSLNGVHAGSASVHRLRLRRLRFDVEARMSGIATEEGTADNREGHADDVTYVHDLLGLVRTADARFSMETSHLCTSSGRKVSSLEVPDGSVCISDGFRCLFDGSIIYAAQHGEPCRLPTDVKANQKGEAAARRTIPPPLTT